METVLGARILPALYGCCERPENWRGLLDEICAGLGVRSAAVQIFRREGARLLHQWQERDSYSHAHASQHDRWINNADNPRLTFDARLASRPLAVLTDADRFGSNSPYVNETRRRLAQVGLCGGTGMLFEFAPSRCFSLILHRQVGDPAVLGGEDAAFLRDIGPHLMSLSSLTGKLQAARTAQATLAAIMDQLRIGVVLCSSAGEVRWRNRAAATMIFDGAPLIIADGRLRGVSADSRQRLARLLSPSEGDGMATACFRQSSGGKLQAIALPDVALGAAVDGGWTDEADGVVLILIDPAQAPPMSAEHVMSLFGLTLAEAQLSVALCQGASLSEYAEHRGVSVGTVRIQMKRILEKTDSRRQSELVGKLYGSVIAQVQGRPLDHAPSLRS